MDPDARAELRDRVIDALADLAPNVLGDEVMLEGILRLTFVEVVCHVAEERARLMGRLREAHDN